jgi:hypothetical protein
MLKRVHTVGEYREYQEVGIYGSVSSVKKNLDSGGVSKRGGVSRRRGGVS